MTALTQDRKTDQVGVPHEVVPALGEFPVAANTIIYGGALTFSDANGRLVPGSATPGLVAQGRCERQADNRTATTGGAAGAINALIRRGAFWYGVAGTGGTAPTIANRGQVVYAADDNNVSATDNGGQFPAAGILLDIDPVTGQAGVLVGFPSLVSAALQSASAANRARNVVTSLQAYGGSGTATLTQTTPASGWAAQDGVTNAVGDVVFIQGGTTNLTAAKDSGPWVIQNLGSASVSWVLVRPDWFANGSTLPVGYSLDIGGEGSIWAGTTWRSFAAVGSAVVGTNDPTFYVRSVSQTVALVLSTFTLSNVGIRNASKSAVRADFQAAGGTTTNTIGYGVVAAPTPGYIGTASAVIDALASGMAKNGTADTSSVVITVTNF